MKLDLSCPVEVRGYALSEDGGAVRASVRLYNLSQRRVAWIEGAAGWFAGGARRMATPFCAGSLRAAGEIAFRVALETSRLPGANRIELRFLRVGFEDGGEWRAGDGPFAEMEPLPPIAPDELDALRGVAGADAVCYPKQTSQVWRCVCGRLNPNGAERCARCHRDHFAALACTPEAARREAGRALRNEGADSEEADAGQDFARKRARRSAEAASEEAGAGEDFVRKRAHRSAEAASEEAGAGEDFARKQARRSAGADSEEAGAGEDFARKRARRSAEGALEEAGAGEDFARKRARRSRKKGSEAVSRQARKTARGAKPTRRDAFDEAEIAALHAQYLRQRSRLLRRTAAAAVLALILAVWIALRPAPSAAPEGRGIEASDEQEVEASARGD